MKRPTWATTIGILAIVFGVLGIFSGAQEMTMPLMLKMQKEMMHEMGLRKTSDGESVPKMTFEVEKEGDSTTVKIPDMFGVMDKFFSYPEWYTSWAIVIGGVSMLIAGIYLLSGIFLLMTKPVAINAFYLAVFLSVIWALVQTAIYISTGNTLLLTQIPGAVASIVIDIIFLVVVLNGNKEAYILRQPPAIPDIPA